MKIVIVPASEITAKKGLDPWKYIPETPKDKTKRKYRFSFTVETTKELSAEQVYRCLSEELTEVRQFTHIYQDETKENPVPVKITFEKIRTVKP